MNNRTVIITGANSGIGMGICAADEFKHTTGKLFNDKLEFMQPSPKEYPGIIKQMKQIWGTSVYPAYRENTNISDQLWARCTELTRNRVVVEDQRIHDTNNVI